MHIRIDAATPAAACPPETELLAGSVQELGAGLLSAAMGSSMPGVDEHGANCSSSDPNRSGHDGPPLHTVFE
eukprot:10509756-Karenia_brevis.AAC.1